MKAHNVSFFRFTDINECDTDNGGCEHFCQNQLAPAATGTPAGAGFTRSRKLGFSLNPEDSQTCLGGYPTLYGS